MFGALPFSVQPHPSLPAISLSLSLFFPSLFCPGMKAETARQEDSATDPLTANKQSLKSSHCISFCLKPPPWSLKWDPPVGYVPSNRSVLCLLTIQMYCPENEWKCQRLFVLVSFHCVCSVSVAVCWLPRIWLREAMHWLGAWIDSLGRLWSRA